VLITEDSSDGEEDKRQLMRDFITNHKFRYENSKKFSLKKLISKKKTSALTVFGLFTCLETGNPTLWVALSAEPMILTLL